MRTRHAAHGRHRLRRIALVAALVVLIPAAFSYLKAISEPSNSSLGIRTVEWLREHGAAGIVSQVESTYYALTAPSKGGPTLRALPRVGARGSASSSTTAPASLAEYRPPRVRPMISPTLAGEGVWRPARAESVTSAPILLTTLRNQPEYPSVVAGLAWIDTQRTNVTLHPGRQEPSVELPRGSMDVPYAARGKLLATFNSAFKLSDSHGGVALNGHTYAPMRNGQATFVGYANGSVNVIDWVNGPTAPPSVVFARQNLPLIVDGGQPSPNLNNGEWGATVGNAVLVWRSGIGVDARGNLIYAAGNDQSVQSLARALIRAGAVRAMELDINSYWVSFITYGEPGAGNPVNLLPEMNRPATRYLEPDDRDFFTVYSR
ncbi:MAG TPA: phosphodiester glycosidase family protein [Solirubrobacteraceae bacterium]|nr:phosphodiester glycosidase family protein [Solirubrobacteraceae bacterium]